MLHDHALSETCITEAYSTQSNKSLWHDKSKTSMRDMLTGSHRPKNTTDEKRKLHFR